MACDLERLSDLATPWCLRVAVTLGLPERLAHGARAAAELAAETDCEADALTRLLRHLAEHGVFEEPEPGRFALTEAARGLLEPAARLALDLDGVGGRLASAWTGLLPAIRGGKCAYHQVFGRPFWQDLGAHPAVADSFDRLMGPDGHGPAQPEVLLTGGWEALRSVVDVGGGRGHLLAAILQAHPHLRGILVDLPRAVAAAPAVFAAAGVAERAQTVAQSFFERLPTGADGYLLSNVLGDWPDAEATALLRRCAEAARPDGRVIVRGGVTPTERPSPELLMLVLVGGRQRTLAEFAKLARDAGLEPVAAGPNRAGGYTVECRPT